MADLKSREQDILNFIISEVQKNGIPPTVRDICAALDIKSTSTVHHSMEILEDEGYIRKLPGKRRAYEILNGAGGRVRKLEEDLVSAAVIQAGVGHGL